MNRDSFVEVIKSRRSIRRFSDKPVRQKDIEQMLDAARLSPSGGNLQAWHFIVIQQRNLITQLEWILKKKIGLLVKTMEDCTDKSENLASSLAKRLRNNSLFFSEAPLTIAVLYRQNFYNEPYINCLMQRGVDRYEAHRCMGYVEIQSAAAATQNLILAAHALGYGSCWMNVPFIAIDEIKAILGVKYPWEISALVPIGFPDSKSPVSAIKKKRLDEIVTYR